MSLWLRRSFHTGVVALAVVVTNAWSMSGPAASDPKYDAATESKIKVIVEELKLPAKGKEKEVAHLVVKSGSETLDIYLCPKSFLDDMGATYAKGDEVTVTGSKIKQEGGDLFLAREVVKGSDTLLLRDDKGKPVWDWRH